MHAAAVLIFPTNLKCYVELDELVALLGVEKADK